MKKIKVLLLFTVAYLGSAVFAQSGAMFEYKTTSVKGNGSIKSYYSSSGSRTEIQISIPQMPGGGFTNTMITKSDAPGTMYTLNDKNKTYTTTHITENEKTAACEKCVVDIIGKEKVGNYNCIHATVTNGSQINEYWTTTEIVEFEKYTKTNSGNKYMNTSGDYGALIKKGAAGFVVKSIVKEKNGETMTLELVKFEKKDFPASYFNLPEDYKAASSGTPATQGIDINKIQSMTPEERQKYMEEMKRQAIEKNGGNK